MKKGYTKIAVVLDRSGSMQTIRDATIEGFNEFLQGQKAAKGEASLTLAQFDDEFETVYNDVNLDRVQPLNRETFVPRGLTALYDAIGKTINSVGEELRMLPERSRPEKVVFVIITDGGENVSREFTYEKITSMIKHQQDVYSWEFLFLGANQDAMAVGSSLSIPVANSVTYAVHDHSVKSAFLGVTRNVSRYRDGGSISYTSAERAEQDEANIIKNSTTNVVTK